MSRRKLPISGPMLQEKALQFAKDLGNAEFRGSNGSLESFRKRNNIAFYVKSGEKADVDIAIVEDWKRKLPTLLEGYNPCDIFNMDETGLFFCTTEDKTLHKKVKNALPVENHANKKAWMTSGIFETLISMWVVKVKKFCCSWIMLHHIQMFSFVM